MVADDVLEFNFLGIKVSNNLSHQTSVQVLRWTCDDYTKNTYSVSVLVSLYGWIGNAFSSIVKASAAQLLKKRSVLCDLTKVNVASRGMEIRGWITIPNKNV